MSPKAAADFCRWLSAKTGRTYRLPTEAEWQFLCVRSGIDRSAIDEFSWHRRNSKYQTHRVATKTADALGLHDLYGNAMEWCVGPDGVPIARGGSFLQSEDEVGCGFRAPLNPDWNASDPQIPKSVWWLADGGFVGFRVVCVPTSTTDEPPKGATP
jgi:formylglycine-generating enzyme required for sulfatase activity